MALTRRKGSGCCCGRCFNSTKVLGDVVGLNGPGECCCSCMPSHACVVLAGYCGGDSAKVAWCDSYSGSFTVNETVVDFQFDTKKEDGVCYLCLTSAALGYEDDGYEDTRVCVAMGGEYNDSDTKKVECKAPDFDFEVDLTPVDPYCEDLGNINFQAADHVAKVDDEVVEECFYHRVCISYKDEYTNNIYSTKACFDNYTDSWTGIIDVDGEDLAVVITLEGTDPTQLSMTSGYFDGDVVEPLCPPYGKMQTTWDSYPEGSSISVTGEDEKTYDCADCNCFCRCLCVTYYDSLGNIARTGLCLDAYDQWSTENNLGPFDGGFSEALAGLGLTFGLSCEGPSTSNGCETQSTIISLSVTGGELISDSSQSIICPDRLEAQWSVEIADEETAEIIIECLDCNGDCNVEDFGVSSGCVDAEDRVSPIPIFLYATIENKTDCANLDGQQILLQLEGDIDTSTCWTGFEDWPNDVSPGGCRTTMSFRCQGNGVFQMYNEGCGFTGGYTGTVISYDPLEVEFEETNPFIYWSDGCCDDGVTSDIKVIVTE